MVNKKTISIAAVAGLLILTVLFIPKDVDKNQGKEASPGQKEKTDQGQPAVELQKLTIDVPNASDAIIVFPDGSSKKLPYDIVGKEGENFQFTLQADGYVSKKIEVPITVGRRSYEYNLEKIKE